MAQFRAERAKKSISLNEAERRAERDREDAKRKQRQAERKALGLALDPLADDDADDGLAASERDIAKDAAREKLAEKRPDPLLRESAAILADAVRLLNNDRKLSAQVLPAVDAAGALGRLMLRKSAGIARQPSGCHAERKNRIAGALGRP